MYMSVPEPGRQKSFVGVGGWSLILITMMMTMMIAMPMMIMMPYLHVCFQAQDWSMFSQFSVTVSVQQGLSYWKTELRQQKGKLWSVRRTRTRFAMLLKINDCKTTRFLMIRNTWFVHVIVALAQGSWGTGRHRNKMTLDDINEHSVICRQW